MGEFKRKCLKKHLNLFELLPAVFVILVYILSYYHFMSKCVILVTLVRLYRGMLLLGILEEEK